MQKDELLRLLRDPNLLPTEKQTLLSNIATQAASLNMPCCLAGGFVRDLLLNKPVRDFDIVVEGDAIKLGKSLVKKFGGKLTLHDKFHTAIWHMTPDTSTPDTIDLITARKETYKHPGALPTAAPSTIEDDLRRRDFTINAMAIRMDGDHLGELLDPLNGQRDLKRGWIRVLHPRSFIDDPTRILRAIRYEKRYTFNLQPSTFNLINPESLAVLTTLSGERLRHEIDLVFEEQNAGKMLLRLASLGVLSAIHSDLPSFKSSYSNLFDVKPGEKHGISHNRVMMGYLLWLMDSSAKSISSIAKRLDFTAELSAAVLSASQVKKDLPSLANSKPSVWTFALEKHPLISIYAVYLVSHERALMGFLEKWRHIKPHTTGDDLKTRGLPPGPRYKEILSQLRAAWLDGEIEDRDQENEFLNAML